MKTTAHSRTYGGGYIDLLDPDPSHFTLDTVAHSLAGCVRFARQTRERFTVAQHAVNCSRLVSSEAAMFALLHEFDEVFTFDPPGPLSGTAVGFALRPLRDAHMRAGSIAFGLPWPWPEAIAAVVKRADLQCLSTEAYHLFGPDVLSDPQWGGLPDPDVFGGFDVWPSDRAEYEFIRRYHELCKGER